MKKQSNVSRLLSYAGGHKYLTYASWVLSALSALLALIPYYYIWLVMREVLEAAPDFAAAQNLTHNGVTMEFLLNLIFYIIITPIISVTLTKIMFQSENAMI